MTEMLIQSIGTGP